MNKIYFLLIFTFCTGILTNAQKRHSSFGTEHLNKKIFTKSNLARPMAECTVLNFDSDVQEYNLFTIQDNMGFVIGTNYYGDIEDASIFATANNETYLTGVNIIFGYANSNIAANLSKTINVNIYEFDNGNIGNTIATVPLTLGDIRQDIDNQQLTEIIFPTAVTIPDNGMFVVSIDISNLTWNYPAEMDSLAILSWDVDYDHENFIVKESSGDWYYGSDLWGATLTQNLAIFPMVSDDPTCSSPAPVTLSAFNVQRKQGRIEIRWTTETEQNNSGFEIQRSSEGADFTTIATVSSGSSSGNSLTPLYYVYNDKNPLFGNNYYRLIQKDKDGKSAYSKIVSVNNTDANNRIIAAYPNPAFDVLNVKLNSLSSQKATISILDLAGRTVMKDVQNVREGDNTLKLNIQSLQSGNYFLKISTPGEENRVLRFVK